MFSSTTSTIVGSSFLTFCSISSTSPKFSPETVDTFFLGFLFLSRTSPHDMSCFTTTKAFRAVCCGKNHIVKVVMVQLFWLEPSQGIHMCTALGQSICVFPHNTPLWVGCGLRSVPWGVVQVLLNGSCGTTVDSLGVSTVPSPSQGAPGC